MPRTNPAVTHCSQPQSDLCWATCVKMALEVKRGVVNLDITPQKVADRVLSDSGINTTIETPGLKGGLATFGITMTGRKGFLSWDEVRAEIDGNRPFIIGYQWKGGGGHLMVAGGYEANGIIRWIYLNDPGRASEEKISYDRLISGNYSSSGHKGEGHTWSDTFLLTW